MTTRPVWLTSAFWFDTIERVVTAVASVALGLIGTHVTDPHQIDWSSFWWTLLFTGVVRFLLCLVGGSVNNTGNLRSASFFLATGKPALAPVPARGEGPTNGPAVDPYRG
jgi:hypothetical protein